ncbi:type II toxin-antitoxin system Phd/YefM family antitoxin [Acidobacteria bacterium AH-259-L09]|nr:type II toxin-antitoxin system Phd/YefM family antitoxin [Acidobacteria bacterium AH-259-L09]
MEKVVAVEEARRKLGKLVVEVASSRQPVIIARRNSERAVLLGYEEYERLRSHEAQMAESRFHEALERIHSAVAKTGVKPEVVKEAIRKVRVP